MAADGPPAPKFRGLRLHNTLTRRKEDFEPIEDAVVALPDGTTRRGRITMYVCGPTVYGRAHIGNARPAVVFDVLFRLLRHLYPDYDVIYARNVTDIDDKIIAAAAQEGVAPAVIAERYERHYVEDMTALGCVAPFTPAPDAVDQSRLITPHATEHVAEMVAMAERLIASGNAYVAEGHVLFDVSSDPDYGSLSNRTQDQLIAGARVEVAPYKRGAADFVLWKPSTPEQPGWESPWGRGRPGWHIECSAMIAAHLGTTIDIHAGGLDLIFPHHENETAQSRCAHGAPLARYWLHNGFLNMAGDTKMSKSLGNVVGVAELLAEGWHGEAIRLALLSAHYRQPLEWSEGLLEDNKARLMRLYRRKGETFAIPPDPEDTPNSSIMTPLLDDLATPGALAELSGDPKWPWYSTKLLGLLGERSSSFLQHGKYPTGPSTGEAVGGEHYLAPTGSRSRDEVEAAIDARLTARTTRDFATADRIRAELMAEGIVLEDRPDGTTDWRRA